MPHVLTEEQARTYDAALCLNVGVKWDMQDPTAISQTAKSLQRDKRRTYGFYSVLEALNVLFSYDMCG